MPASTSLRAGGAGLGRQFARMIGVKRDIDGLAAVAQQPRQLVSHARRLGDRHAGMDADDLDMLDLREASP